jgi:hypothetical protein
MRPTVDAAPSQEPSYLPAATESLPDDFTPGAKLEAGCVRFVCILPAVFGDSSGFIRCRTCIRRSEPGTIPYLALSYAWGDPTPKHLVLVDGERRLIAENPWQFPCEAKTKSEQFSCWLWIDALSIDQSDAEERRHQVGMMFTIFQQASQVLVWLGQAYDNSDVVMQVLKLEEEPHTTSIRSNWVMGEWDLTSSLYYADDSEDLRYWRWLMGVSKAVVNLCQRPFWKRLWVFQELRHAEDIRLVCGQHIITWAAFRKLWSVIAELHGLNEWIWQPLRNSLSTKMITLRTKPMNFSLWNLLKETKNLDCADEHDRVYALLSLATDGHEGIEADYHASISSLGHSILRNRYALRPPTSLDDVMTNCDFLRDILRLSWTEIYGYGDFFEGMWVHKIGSPDSSFAGWAEHHHHPAVTKLLLDTT